MCFFTFVTSQLLAKIYTVVVNIYVKDKHIFLKKVNSRLTSQFINSISSVLQKLLKYFNSKIISTSFVLSSSAVFPVMFTLYLNDSEFYSSEPLKVTDFYSLLKTWLKT